jgi:hypothetical protein
MKGERSSLAGAVLSALLGVVALCPVGIAQADGSGTLGSALHGAAGGPLALAVTHLFAEVERDTRPGPRLAAPGFSRELEHTWSVAPGTALEFDSMRAVLDLASVLGVVPALPRLDGRPHLAITNEATSEAVSNAAGCAPVHPTMPGTTTCDRVVDAATLAAAGQGERTSAPGAELRGAGSRLLRSFGLGSISGQPVLVLDGTEDAAAAARQDLDALAWLHLPPRPWQALDVDDDLQTLAPRSRRGRSAVGVTTKLTMRSASLRLIGTF